MRVGIRTILLMVAIVAISIPLLRNVYHHATYLPLDACELAWPTNYEGPYIHCLSAYDENWCRVRMIFLQRIGTEQAWKKKKFLKWVDFQYNHQFGTRVFVAGRLVVPSESVLVYYADGDLSPKYVEFELDEIPLMDPYWPDAEELWKKIHAQQRD